MDSHSSIPHPARMARSSDPLSKLREIIFAFPETKEKISHGSATFWGGRKTFASFHDNHHGDGRVALWLKLPPGGQEELVEAQPERFFVPPYVGPSGWVGVRLDDNERRRVKAGLEGTGWHEILAYQPRHRLRRQGFKLVFERN